MKPLLGAIEAGGTKFVCAVGSSSDDIYDEIRFPTTTPEETLSKALKYFKTQTSKYGPLSALGIGAFGPVNLDKNSAKYGFITSTPKEGWRDTSICGFFQDHLNVPVAFDTDVNAAALGEGRLGAAAGLKNYIYLTVGTGIGGGAIINGNPVHGLIHPEMGHFYINQNRSKDQFPGSCPYHETCLEGLASGPAIEQRWGQKGQSLPADHEAWELESDYLSQACMVFITCYSPEMIILGGGVMKQQSLFKQIRSKTKELLNGYVDHPLFLGDLSNYIVPPALGDQAGICGAFELAERK